MGLLKHNKLKTKKKKKKIYLRPGTNGCQLAIDLGVTTPPPPLSPPFVFWDVEFPLLSNFPSLWIDFKFSGFLGIIGLTSSFFIVSTSLSYFKTFPLFIEFVSDGDDNLISFNVVFLFIGGIGGLVSCFFSELEFIDGAGDDLLELNGDGINGVEENPIGGIVEGAVMARLAGGGGGGTSDKVVVLVVVVVVWPNPCIKSVVPPADTGVGVKIEVEDLVKLDVRDIVVVVVVDDDVVNGAGDGDGDGVIFLNDKDRIISFNLFFLICSLIILAVVSKLA